MIKTVKVVIVGFGNVGRELARIIALKNSVIQERFDLRLAVAAVVDSKGAAVKVSGFTSRELMELLKLPRSAVGTFKHYGIPGAGIREVYEHLTPDIHVEVTPSNYVSGEPGVSNITYALRNGVNIASCNKSPFALKFNDIMKLARAKGAEVRFKATVMGGVPLLDMLASLKGLEVKKVEGVLNATANYILTEMSEKLVGFDEALRRARQVGLVEANPELDIKGWDAAAKLVIISNVLGHPLRLNEVLREDVSKVDIGNLIKARKEGYVIKYVASLNVGEGGAVVCMRRLPRHDFLAMTSGRANAVRVLTEINEVKLAGDELGPVSTAYGVLDDMITLAQQLRTKH